MNNYAPLAANVSAGGLQLQVADITPLGALPAGTRLLIYQHTGADAGGDNTANYGIITNLQNTGRYEIVEVASTEDRDSPSTDLINLQSICGGTVNAYNSSQGAQIITLPTQDDITITNSGSVTGLTYNRTNGTGGVVALVASNSITINGQIIATGLGFKGGVTENVSDNLGTDRTDYRSNSNARGANKGQSLDITPPTGNFGRGALISGGGGGNTHNAGGGGGGNGNNGNTWTGQGVMVNFPTFWDTDPGYIANANALTNSSGGGRGGYSTSTSNQDAETLAPAAAAWGGNLRRERGGLGGRPVANDAATRLFLGGGGGAGDGNDSAAGAGGDGGGIIILIAPTISGTGSIVSNGTAGANSTGIDGAGGGGAGGTIAIDSTTLSNTLTLTANGGNGGNQVIAAPGNEAQGPGGGGGGGYIQYNGGTPTVSVAGGVGGTSNSLAVTEFTPNGATNGATGLATTTDFTVVGCSTTPLLGYGLITGEVFDDLDNSGTKNGGETGIGSVTFFLTPNGQPERQVVTNTDGTFSRTVPAGLIALDVEPNQERLWPRIVNSTANQIQSTTAVINSTVAFDLVGYSEPNDLCAIDWTTTHDPNDYFGGYPSTGLSSPTQDGRIPLNYAEFLVGVGNVIFFQEGEHMLDGNNDGLVDLPALFENASFGFGAILPVHVFYRKTFTNLIVNSGPTDGIDPIDQLNINYYYPYQNGASNVRFMIYDVDNAGSWIDQVTVSGVGLGNVPVSPTITALRGGSAISISGNSATGVAASSDTNLSQSLANSGNLLVDFGSTPIRSMNIYYENTLFNPSGNQGIGFTKILFTGCDQEPGRVEGHVFQDDNGNQVQDPGEPDLGNVTVTVTTFDGVPFKIKTQANGDYAIDVPAGQVTLTVDSLDSDIIQPSVNTTNNAVQVVNVTTGNTTTSGDVGYQSGGPTLLVQIDSELSLVGSLTSYQYYVTWDNTALPGSLNVAYNPVLTVTFPNRINYLSGGINPGSLGTISHNNGVVTITLSEPVQPGGTGSAFLNVRTINPVGQGNITVPVIFEAQNFLSLDVEPALDDVEVTVDDVILAVSLLDFSVIHQGAGSKPLVTWTTAAELGTAGFDVYRLAPGVKAKLLKGSSRVNVLQINPLGSETNGARYEIIDPMPLEKSEERFYLLKETEFGGAEILYGPVSTKTIPSESSTTQIQEWSTYQ